MQGSDDPLGKIPLPRKHMLSAPAGRTLRGSEGFIKGSISPEMDHESKKILSLTLDESIGPDTLEFIESIRSGKNE